MNGFHATATPNDPRFAEQWALHNTGQSGSTPRADIDAPLAWDRETGSADVLVAVIDTGMDPDHPDLLPNRFTNPNEIQSTMIKTEPRLRAQRAPANFGAGTRRFIVLLRWFARLG